MKLFIAQMKILPGNVQANIQTMKDAFDRARSADADCIVFPRFALTGPTNRALPVDWSEIRKYAGTMPFFLSGDALDDSPLHGIAHVTHGSDFYVVGRREVENKELSHLAKDSAMPVVCVNGVGTDNTGKNIYALAGGSRVFDCDGRIVFEMPLFSEADAVIEFVDGNVQVEAESVAPHSSEIAEIHDALVFMIRENLKMFHISRMVIGASGGIDSAVSAVLYSEAIGPENVFLVNMPTRFNSDTTKNAARDLAENLGTPYMVAPISEI